ncbi:splicing factor, suppressor of white-apricot homolog isoform X6 [Mytilus californianus]|uniref:splicing factor, suppressor of white-apricot homolog isoform X3 n=1 Tax=Mytilus californianus TaxID=6549 RepID=UPI002246F2FA|nr:splicing factor, suppressor of white-apricot homolog isoform X3 [Mytilus californianus]XP_052073900.1 splicing factor, suppressor of white-apricot homolog isoform X4 [Mytilus californianus]XP_052073901.1 splicing factor, suppressor of white-apricot homolog isoform X5 [Mytilus californianus]XP_052073902.1 splicing factor, suppressor of white-apricot homolog isoform X6 [Mytilus californianus]
MAALIWDIPEEESQQSKEPEELSVFGYACKLFRDDRKAFSIDEGEHLIPWMGDSSLLIDRYDGRGHLFDLSKYDATHVKRGELSEEDKQIEALCDEERYLELKNDLAEKKMYEEEEWKRYYQSLSEGFNAVGFSYDHQHHQDYMETQVQEPEPVFIVPEDLQVPTDMEVPDTEKQHAFIEKTAKFIAGHGMQMEIIIKTKQAKNSQFDFLHFEDPLNQYYKHMVNMIKSGKYKPKQIKEEDDDSKGQYYKHMVNMIKSGKYKPKQIKEEDDDNKGQYYKHMVNMIKSGKYKPKQIKEEDDDNKGQYYKHMVNMIKSGKYKPKQIKEEDDDNKGQYYKHMVNMIKSGKYKPKQIKEEDDDNKDDDAPHSQHGYLHPSLVQTHTTKPNLAPAVKMPAISIHDTPYGKLLKHLKKSTPDSDRNSNSPTPNQDPYSGKSYSPQPTSSTPPPESSNTFIHQTTDYHHMHPGVPPPPGLEPVTLPSSNQPPPPGTELEGPLIPPHLQQQVMEEEPEEEKPPSVQHAPVMMGPSLEPKVIPPPPDIQPIIDRMAMYVAKNGVEFEIVVRSKNDPRFEFLQPWHSYFRYYNSKKKIFIEEVLKEREKLEKEKPAKLSFSIKNKSKDQDGVVSSEKKVFDHDSSGDEDSESARDRSIRSDMSGTSTPVDGESSRISSDERQSERSEKKLAHEKLKDKLAMAAREKLSKASREKQIQAERKRKAAMFINMLKSTKSSDENKNGGTPSSSRSHTPAPSEEPREDNEPKRTKKSKYSRSRSRSPKRSKPRSRSRSPRKRKSPAPPPPSAFPSIRRSESRSPSRYKTSRQSSPYQKSRSPSRKRSRSPSAVIIIDPPTKTSKKSKKSKKSSRTKSRSPSRKSSRKYEDSDALDSIRERLSASPAPLPTSISPDISARISQPVDEDSNSTMSTDSSKNVSNYMLHRVRALIKASKEAVKKEEDIFEDT